MWVILPSEYNMWCKLQDCDIAHLVTFLVKGSARNFLARNEILLLRRLLSGDVACYFSFCVCACALVMFLVCFCLKLGKQDDCTIFTQDNQLLLPLLLLSSLFVLLQFQQCWSLWGPCDSDDFYCARNKRSSPTGLTWIAINHNLLNLEDSSCPCQELRMGYTVLPHLTSHGWGCSFTKSHVRVKLDEHVHVDCL